MDHQTLYRLARHISYKGRNRRRLIGGGEQLISGSGSVKVGPNIYTEKDPGSTYSRSKNPPMS